MMKKCTAVGLLQLLCINYSVFGFPGGGPAYLCQDPYPKHHVAPQTSQAPVKVDVNSSVYAPGDIIQLTVTANKEFSGFMFSARSAVLEPQEIFGEFINTSAGKLVAWYPQRANDKNCITHKTPRRNQQVVALWKAPSTPVGNIHFSGSIVTSFTTFWVGIKSKTVSLASGYSGPTSYPTKPKKLANPTGLINECGKTKGCMLYPSYCKGPDCTQVVSWKATSMGVTIEIISKPSRSPGYAGLGLSSDRTMGDDLTFSCLVKGDTVMVQRGYNPSEYKVNELHRPVGLSNVETIVEDGKIYCRFHTEIFSNISRPQGRGQQLATMTIDLRRSWYLFLAWGTVVPGAQYIGKHEEIPIISRVKVDLQSTDIVRADGLRLELKIHAGLGIVAWLFFAGLGRLLARHFRNSFNGKEINDIKIWFHIHRSAMVLVVASTIALVIIVFVTLRAWTKVAQIHAILGMTVVGLSVLQFLGGLCRPHPDGRTRPVFNWLHRISGLLAHACAVIITIVAVTIMLAVWSPFIHKDFRFFMTISVGGSIGLQLLWDLIFEIARCCRLRSNKESDENKATNSVMEYVGLAMYIITMLLAVVASVLFIYFF